MVASNINKHRKIFEKFTTLCRAVSSFSDCQKHEYITVKTLQGDEETKTLQCLHFVYITHGLIILLFCIQRGWDWLLRALDLNPIPSYLKVLRSVNPGNYPYNCLFRAILSNIDLRQLSLSQAPAILWRRSIFFCIAFRNSYYRVSKFW